MLRVEQKLISFLKEEWPTQFDFNHFKTLSHKEQLKYCTENLPKLKKGSSRIVFGVDGERVIKMAFNQAGLVQNRTESD